MRNRIFVPVGCCPHHGAVWWGSVLIAQTPSGTKSFDPKITNTDAAIKAAAETTKAMEDARKEFHGAENTMGRSGFARLLPESQLYAAGAAERAC